MATLRRLPLKYRPPKPTLRMRLRTQIWHAAAGLRLLRIILAAVAYGVLYRVRPPREQGWPELDRLLDKHNPSDNER